MNRIQQITTCLSFAVMVYSSRGQVSDDICKEKFESAKQLAYGDPMRQSALDSAMTLL